MIWALELYIHFTVAVAVAIFSPYLLLRYGVCFHLSFSLFFRLCSTLLGLCVRVFVCVRDEIWNRLSALSVCRISRVRSKHRWLVIERIAARGAWVSHSFLYLYPKFLVVIFESICGTTLSLVIAEKWTWSQEAILEINRRINCKIMINSGASVVFDPKNWILQMIHVKVFLLPWFWAWDCSCHSWMALKNYYVAWENKYCRFHTYFGRKEYVMCANSKTSAH